MTSSWNSLGRAVGIVAIVLLTVAVGYLWVDDESDDTEAPQSAHQAPDIEKETAEFPHQPPLPTSTDAGTYRQSTESAAAIDDSPPPDLQQ